MAYGEGKHKYSTYAILLFIFIVFIAILGGALTTDDLDEICDVNGSVLYRYAGEWICGSIPQTDVYNITNNYILSNGTMNGTINYLPKWGTNNSLIDSLIRESTGMIIVNGTINATAYVGISTEYQPLNITTIYGTHNDGDVDSIRDRNAESYNVTESAGANPMEIHIGFENVTEINYMYIRAWYTGSAGHEIEVGLYDYTENECEYEYQIEITDSEHSNTYVKHAKKHAKQEKDF